MKLSTFQVYGNDLIFHLVLLLFPQLLISFQYITFISVPFEIGYIFQLMFVLTVVVLPFFLISCNEIEVTPKILELLYPDSMADLLILNKSSFAQGITDNFHSEKITWQFSLLTVLVTYSSRCVLISLLIAFGCSRSTFFHQYYFTFTFK